jgi:hypothetical protein
MRLVREREGGEEDVLSALQHMRHIHPGSPSRTVITVKLLNLNKHIYSFTEWFWGGSYITLDIRVQRLPKKVRKATVRAWDVRSDL